MKYIINESQYKVLLEGNVPFLIRRRANREILEKYISDSEELNPPLCNRFQDGYDYADTIIDESIEDFLLDLNVDYDEEPNINDILDYLKILCRELFGNYLVRNYEDSCFEDKFDDEEYNF
jgi:hypothetical protein